MRISDLLQNPVRYAQQVFGQLNDDAGSFNANLGAAASGDVSAKNILNEGMFNLATMIGPGSIRSIKAYHGSKNLGDSWFDNAKLGSNTVRYDDSGMGHFASSNPKVANEFAGSPLEDVYPVRDYGRSAAGLKDYKNKIPKEPVEGAAVYPVKVALKNPRTMTASEYRKTFFDDSSVDVGKIRKDLIEKGHDGIKVIGDPRSDWGELRATNYIAFEPSSFTPWFVK